MSAGNRAGIRGHHGSAAKVASRRRIVSKQSAICSSPTVGMPHLLSGSAPVLSAVTDRCSCLPARFPAPRYMRILKADSLEASAALTTPTWQVRGSRLQAPPTPAVVHQLAMHACALPAGDPATHGRN